MNYQQAITTSKPQFIQLIRSMNEENLNQLRIDFESQFKVYQRADYEIKYSGDCNLYKGVLISKLLDLYNLILNP